MATNRSVDRALEVLRLVAESPRPLRPSELSQRSGIPKATLHALLASLEGGRFLTRLPDGFRIGIGAFEVGTAVPVVSSLRAGAAAALDALADETGEACHLGTLVGGDVLYLDRRDQGMHGLRFAVRIGHRLPAYATGLGKAMLAQLPDDRITRLYPARLPAVTDRTLAARDDLLTALADVRRQGFAVESGESTPGVRCLGMAVQVPGHVLGVSVTVPAPRATAEDLVAHAPAVGRALAAVREAAVTSGWLAPGRPLLETTGR